MNFFRGTVTPDGAQLMFAESGGGASPLRLRLDTALARKAAGHIGRPLILGLRPENVEALPTAASADPGRAAEVTIEVVEPMGAETYLYLDSGATAFVARVRASDRFAANQRLTVAFAIEQAHLFDAATEQVLK
jgi:multiple sugar transport system ATP-binding protein